MSGQFRWYAPFAKVDDAPDGSIYVHAVINDETVDDEGELMDYAGTKAALDDFMKWANVREMHQHSAVGTVDSITHDDLTKVSAGILHIVDPLAVLKVREGVYKGTSLGGSKGTDIVMEKVGGAKVRRIRQPLVKELSLVDRPSRPTAELTLMKLSDSDVAEPTTEGADAMSQSTDPAVDQAAAATAPPDAAAPAADPAGDAPRGNSPEVPAVGKSPDPALEKPQPVNAPDKEPIEKAATTAELAKSASQDIVTADLAIESLSHLIEQQIADGKTEADVAPLHQAVQLVQQFAGQKVAELTAPENIQEVIEQEAEVIPIAFAYGAVIGDLAKRAAAHLRLAKVGKRNAAKDQQTIQQIHDLAVAAGATEADGEGDADASEADAGDGAEAAAKLAKATAIGGAPENYVDSLFERYEQNAPLAKAADVQAVKGELLEVLRPFAEQLAKIAAQPASGGPVRYAPDPRGIVGPGDTGQVSEAVSGVLAKVSDPGVREELGRHIAAMEIAAIQRG